MIEIDKMGLSEFQQYMKQIKISDQELVDKLVLLGGNERESTNEIQRLIAQSKEPVLFDLATKFKNGENEL